MATASAELALWGSQHEFVFSDAKNVAVFGGVGSGKSYAGAVRGLLASLGTIGSTPIKVPNVGVVTAPTYTMLRDATIRTYRDILATWGIEATFNKTTHLMALPNGSEIIFRTASDPEVLRGPSISWWHGDEAALYGPTVWPIMIARLRQHGVRGWAWLTTTPKGRNWIWQRFIQDQKDNYAHWKLSTRRNPFIEREYADELRAAYSGDFAAQELEGDFVAFEGLIYPEFRREVHCVSLVPDVYSYAVAGVDWGFANPGVILPYIVDSDGRMTQAGEFYQRQRRIEDWVATGKQARETWKIKTFFCDPAEPDYIKAFQAAGLPAVQANNTVSTGIQMVKARLVVQKDGRPRLMVRSDAVYTISEYESYQWAENRYGVRDEPVKANDHAMDATRYAVMGVDAGRRPLAVEMSRYA